MGGCYLVNVMEMNGRLNIESESRKHSVGDGAESGLRVDVEAKESCNDTEMTPCVAAEAMDTANESVFFEVKVIDEVLDADDTELVCSVDVLSNNTELQHWLEAAESKSCSQIQLREVVNHAEVEPCKGACVNEVLSSAELEPNMEDYKTESLEEHCRKDVEKEAQNDGDMEPKEVLIDSEMDRFRENHALEKFSNGNIELFSSSNEVKEAPYNPGLVNTDKVKEPTNDDVHSEVSNPNLSPKQVTSSLTISSQPLDVHGSEHGGCGEITSACSWNTFAQGSFHEEEHSKCNLESVSTARVVLEIPKHVRPTGIRKITFKFSKRKDDCDTDLSFKPLADDKFHEDLYDNQISVSAADSLSIDGFHNDEWSALENSKVKLSMIDGECLDTRSPSSCVPNMELKMSKKIIPDNYPTNVKKLLSTGILEGAKVKYISCEVCVVYVLSFLLIWC